MTLSQWCKKIHTFLLFNLPLEKIAHVWQCQIWGQSHTLISLFWLVCSTAPKLETNNIYYARMVFVLLLVWHQDSKTSMCVYHVAKYINKLFANGSAVLHNLDTIRQSHMKKIYIHKCNNKAKLRHLCTN